MPHNPGNKRYLIFVLLFLGLFMVGVTHTMAMDQMMPVQQDCTSASKCCDCTVPEISKAPDASPIFSFESVPENLPSADLDFIPLSFYHPPK